MTLSVLAPPDTRTIVTGPPCSYCEDGYDADGTVCRDCDGDGIERCWANRCTELASDEDDRFCSPEHAGAWYDDHYDWESHAADNAAAYGQGDPHMECPGFPDPY